MYNPMSPSSAKRSSLTRSTAPMESPDKAQLTSASNGATGSNFRSRSGNHVSGGLPQQPDSRVAQRAMGNFASPETSSTSSVGPIPSIPSILTTATNATGDNHLSQTPSICTTKSVTQKHPHLQLQQPMLHLSPDINLSFDDHNRDYRDTPTAASDSTPLHLPGLSPSSQSMFTPAPPAPPAPSPAMSNSSNSLFSTPSSYSRQQHNSSFSNVACRSSFRPRDTQLNFPICPLEDYFTKTDLSLMPQLFESPVGTSNRNLLTSFPPSNLQQSSTASLSRFTTSQLSSIPPPPPLYQKSSSYNKLTAPSMLSKNALLSNSSIRPSQHLRLDASRSLQRNDEPRQNFVGTSAKDDHSQPPVKTSSSPCIPTLSTDPSPVNAAATAATTTARQSSSHQAGMLPQTNRIFSSQRHALLGNNENSHNNTDTSFPVKPPVTYAAARIVGSGSFGVVYKAQEVETGHIVAIKRVHQDRRYKNRELQIMRELNSPCVVHLRHAFFTGDEEKDEVFLNLVMDYGDDTVHREMKYHAQRRQPMPMELIKIYSYQLCRALAYIHGIGICHRDIKPQNLLLDSKTHSLRLCDFGSAKRLVPGSLNVAYICSRYYRAPELIFGATDYTTAIDIWSLGCVIAEMLLGRPLFRGDTGVDQLVDIIKVLGTPTRTELMAMNRNYSDFKFPYVHRVHWEKVFRTRPPPAAIDLVSQMLEYSPPDRIHPMEALAHEFFDDIRIPPENVAEGVVTCPNCYNFTADELRSCSPEVRQKILPKWARKLPSLTEYLSHDEAEEFCSFPPTPSSMTTAANTPSSFSSNMSLSPRSELVVPNHVGTSNEPFSSQQSSKTYSCERRHSADDSNSQQPGAGCGASTVGTNLCSKPNGECFGSLPGGKDNSMRITLPSHSHVPARHADS